VSPPLTDSLRAVCAFATAEYASTVAFGLPPGKRLNIAVLSPHLDDGVLSLGASIAQATQSGHRVTVVTVFAGDPESTASPGRWDRRAGFVNAGEATRVRRAEDARACKLLGAETVWLDFADGDYEEERNDNAIWAAIDSAVQQADAVLLPGRPLIHPDHAWLTTLVLARHAAGPSLGAYAELPYDAWKSIRPLQSEQPFTRLPWIIPEATLGTRLLKWRATRAYESQLRWLGRGREYHRALLRTRIGNERVAWPMT
jgi:LmbE family N-acetylglucosaminyl deacetylase